MPCKRRGWGILLLVPQVVSPHFRGFPNKYLPLRALDPPLMLGSYTRLNDIDTTLAG